MESLDNNIIPQFSEKKIDLSRYTMSQLSSITSDPKGFITSQIAEIKSVTEQKDLGIKFDKATKHGIEEHISKLQKEIERCQDDLQKLEEKIMSEEELIVKYNSILETNQDPKEDISNDLVKRLTSAAWAEIAKKAQEAQQEIANKGQEAKQEIEATNEE